MMFELEPVQEYLILKRLAKRYPRISLAEVDRVLARVRVTILDRQTAKLQLEVERDLFNYHAPIINKLLKDIG
jgi:hypothetical protein